MVNLPRNTHRSDGSSRPANRPSATEVLGARLARAACAVSRYGHNAENLEAFVTRGDIVKLLGMGVIRFDAATGTAEVLDEAYEKMIF